ncbi:MAG: hypothetical protein AAGC47_01515, partial [Bacteroidota bacterium]
MNKILSLFFCLLSGLGFGQTTIKGIVYDGQSMLPVAKANVKIGKFNVDTDSRGNFDLEFADKEEIEIYSPGFYEYVIDFKNIPNDKRAKFYLTPL